MGFFCRPSICLFKFIFYFSIFFAIVVLLPNIAPNTKFTAVKLEPRQPLTGVLSLNNDLGNAQRLYEGKLSGPEAFAVKDGEIYTSLATGEIVKVSPGGHVTFVTKLGQPCSGPSQENVCGRPLGIEFDLKKNVLYVADSYLGIWKVDLKSNKKQLLVSPHVEIGGRRPMLFNAVALDNKGQLYWTDSSSDFTLKDGVMSILTNPTGRLFYYNEAKNESTVLLDNLWFTNGLGVSPDNKFVVVAESGAYRITKYYIKGPKKGQSEVLLAGIPGVPDNIRVLPDGSGFLLSLYKVYDDNNPNLMHSLAETPLLRKFLVRLMRLVQIPLELLNNYFPHVILEEILYMVGNFKSLTALTPKQSGLLQIDWNGNIVASYYNLDGSIDTISDAIVYGDLLYLGSPHYQDFIGAVPAPPLLKKAFAKPIDSKPKEVPKDNVRPVHDNKNAQIKPTVEKKVVAQNTLNEKEKVHTKHTKATVEKIEKHKSDVKQPEPAKPTVIKQTPPKQADTQQVPAPKPVETKQAPVKQATTQKVPAPKQESKQATTQPPPTKPIEKKQDPPSQVKEKQTPSAAKPKENTQASPKQAPPTQGNTPTKPAEQKKTTQKETKQSEPKKASNVDAKPTTKPVESQKPVTKKQETKPLPVPTPESKEKIQKPVESQTETSKPIPIKEDIPSDTVKPNKETLKVIKKEGPTEIPVPSP